MEKECTQCNKIKNHKEFNKKKRSKLGIRSECKSCQSVQTKKYRTREGAETIRRYNVQSKYKISLEEYELHLSTPCEICGKASEHLDHCHDTGKVRGGLCRNCNLMLGFAVDSTDILNNAIKYLEASCTVKNT